MQFLRNSIDCHIVLSLDLGDYNDTVLQQQEEFVIQRSDEEEELINRNSEV